MSEKTKVKRIVNATENFHTCPFCGATPERLDPLHTEGVYSYCPKCGATGGVNRKPDGGLYMYWTAGRYAHSVEEDPTSPIDGLKVFVPNTAEHITDEHIELYKLVHYCPCAEGWEVGKAFTTLQAMHCKAKNETRLDIAWIASLAYGAGRINGIRHERARKRGTP